MHKNNGKILWQPFATSTPRKSLTKPSQHNDLLKNNFIKSSDILKQILINQNESPNQTRKQMKTQKNRKKNSVFCDGIPSASSSDDEDDEDVHVLLTKKKKLVINISSTSCKEAREQEKSQLSESDILTSNKVTEDAAKSGSTKTVQKPVKKSIGKVTNKKNVSTVRKNTFDITLQKSRDGVKKALKKNSSNAFMFEKLGSDVTGVGQENKKPSERAEICAKQDTLDVYFKQIKNKSVSNPKVKIKTDASKTIGQPECSEKIKPKKINKKKANNDNLEPSGSENVVSVTNATKPEEQEGVANDVNYDTEIFSSPYNSDKAPSKLRKMAGKSRSNVSGNEIIPVKKRRVKTQAECEVDKIKNDISDKNSSHQLFSNSKEQELLNSLDLTKEDTNDSKSQEPRPKAKTPVKGNQVAENHQEPPEELKTKTFVDSSTPVVGSIECGNVTPAEYMKKSEKKQLKKNIRKKQQVLLNSLHDQVVKNNCSTDNLVEAQENKDQVSHGNITKYITAKEKLSKIPICSKTSVFKNVEVPVKSILKKSENNLMKHDEELKQTMEKDNECVVESSDAAIKTAKLTSSGDDTNKVTSCKIPRDNEVVSSTGPGMSDVFKKLNSDSEFNEFKPGCLTAELWALKTYKCGMLKMKAQSKHSSKTTSENSYFGGVVVNGSLKMTINQNETELTVGDMAFVPPLTEWSIQNFGDKDADMYYWCGKFRA